MEIRHIRYFKAVADELHFGKAAKKLFISQPPLTRQIKELEEELGVLLLTRNNKRVALTDAGNYFLRECDQLLQQLERAKQQVVQVHLAETGNFRLGYISSTPKSALAEVLQKVKSEFPYLQVQLYEMPSHAQRSALETGKLDLGIVRAPIFSEHLKIEKLFDDSFVLALPKDYAYIEDLKYLANEMFISYNNNYAPNYHLSFLETCSRIGFTPEIAHECNTTQSILDLVHYRTGIAIVPKSVQHEYRHLAIKFVDLAYLGTTTQIIMAWDHKNQNVALSEFRKWIKIMLKNEVV
ncbi:LysR family transcriptional regulator [Sphingobacterium pedocola]|uniref:LysR family transcriptional regulator n=1 Tax=Sphingobacterium pedocola TaxID=2082722 RepID=A0ABR9T5J3_9SPHI|nr:LysR family transcriptional regulator [Sphingobacterium pedocola]MBE8720605.1 LysR family transcriptional regulator [Sphingobacterium pedocola]